MSYIVLARQYRPKNFAEMVGQDHVVRALSNALQNQRLHHAYLFTGTRGVGKTTVSRILAKSLNCVGADGQGGITNEPCGVCQACRDIDAGRFVDYIELDAASNRGVDEISQLLEQAVYKPVAGRFKVFMIDEVHMLSNTAFNAMLKTLEEPPEYLKFVLATTDPQKVPVTVLSRCLQFNLRSMAPETISEHLQQVLSQEQVQFDASSLRLISRAARGSMRDALSLTDQAIAYGSGNIEEAAVRQMLGSVDQTHIYQLIQALAQGQGHTVVELVNHMRMQSLSAKAALEEMVNVLQRMAILRVAPDTAVADDPEDAQTAALIPLLEPDEVQLLYSIVLNGQEELGLASDEYAAMVMVLLRMLAFKPVQQAPVTASNTPHTANTATTAEKKTELTPPATSKVDAPSLPQEKHTQPAQEAVKAAVTPPVSVPSAPSAPPMSEISPRHDEKLEPSAFSAQDDELPPWVSEPIPETASTTEHPSVEPAFEPPPVEKNTRTSSSMAQSNVAVTPELAQAPVQNLSAPAIKLPAPTAQTQHWETVVKHLLERELVTALVRELVLNSQAETISSDEQQWSFKCHRQTLLGDINQKKLAEAMQTLFGHPVHLSFQFGEVCDTPALRLQAELQKRQKAAEQSATEDPDLQKWLQDFPGAQLIPGSTRAV